MWRGSISVERFNVTVEKILLEFRYVKRFDDDATSRASQYLVVDLLADLERQS